jgi:hypothetical protein
MAQSELISPFDAHSVVPTHEDHKWREKLDADLFKVARKAGLTDDPDVYSENYARYFGALDELDTLLNERRYLLGEVTMSAPDQWLRLSYPCTKPFSTRSTN